MRHFILGRHLILVRFLVFVASHTDNFLSYDDTTIEILADRLAALCTQEYDLLLDLLKEEKPGTVVHFAKQRKDAHSMI